MSSMIEPLWPDLSEEGHSKASHKSIPRRNAEIDAATTGVPCQMRQALLGNAPDVLPPNAAAMAQFSGASYMAHDANLHQAITMPGQDGAAQAL